MVSESHSVMSDSAAPWTIQSMELSRPERETDTEALGVCAGAAAALVMCSRESLYHLSHWGSPTIKLPKGILWTI